MLLRFPDVWRQSNRQLGERWGVAESTIRNWREGLTAQFAQCAAANLSDADLLENFSMTRGRLEEMHRLVQTGERVGADGRVTQTQASETKKRDEREVAIEAYRNAAGEIKTLIGEVVMRFPSLQTAHVRRRLFTAFDMNLQENASKWALPAIRQQLERQKLLRDALMDEGSAWSEELRRLHEVNVLNEKLTHMGGPYSVQPCRSRDAKLLNL